MWTPQVIWDRFTQRYQCGFHTPHLWNQLPEYLWSVKTEPIQNQGIKHYCLLWLLLERYC